MKKTGINLHIEYGRTLLAVVAFSLTSLFLDGILFMSLDSDFGQLNSLWHSDYTYSVNMRDSIGRDDYYQINAGICFSLSENAETSLNADIVMQSFESEYSEQVYWNARKLPSYGVAVSAGIAEENGLEAGDKLYSKRIVDDKTCEYTIEQILPEVSSVRLSEHQNYSNGIIIMGYDSLYIDNISHSVLAFTKEPVNQLYENFSDMPTDILYRDDEMAFVCRDILPYITTFVILSVLCAIGLVAFFTKNISCNFSRLAALGFPKKQLDKAYNCDVCRFGFLSIFFSFCSEMIILIVDGFYPVEMYLLITILFIEFATLIITSMLARKRLWRK